MISNIMLMFGFGTRINGWRRLGRDILLNFTEQPATDVDGKEVDFPSPKISIAVYVGVPGPIEGDFGSHAARPIFEIVEAICTFALNKPVSLFQMHWSCTDDEVKNIAERHLDVGIGGLARKGISLDIFDRLPSDGGHESFLKLRAALMTFSAALRQERDPVACLLFVISAESLSNPPTSWKLNKITKRFVSFFDDLLSDDIDNLIRMPEVVEAFEISISDPPSKNNRRKFLNKVYGIRSNIVHEGVGFSYSGLINFDSGSEGARREILSRFAEAAILRFIESPRNCIIGHPKYEKI